MKKVLLLLSLLTSVVVYSQNTVRALFLGNSYTAVNTLPLLVKRMANSTGDLLSWNWNTPGGYTRKTEWP